MGKIRSTLGVVAIGTLASFAWSTGAVGAAVARAQDVFVTNDDAHAVPVRSIGTSQVGGTVDVGNFPAASPVLTEMTRLDWTPGQGAQGMDISAFRTIRVAVIAGSDCSATPGPTQRVIVQEGQTAYPLDTFEISYPADDGSRPVERTYEVPGRSLVVFGPSACHAGIVVWGRG
jgi:hypothetical protein